MAHSHLNKRKAFAFIADELAAGRQPTDAAIVDLCGFSGVEQARTLLADLADEGAITLAFADGARTVALGPKERTKAAPSPVPIPSVIKPASRAVADIDEDAAAARLMSIVRREPAAPLLSIVPETPAPSQPEPKTMPVCQPSPAAEGRRTLSFSVPGEIYLAIAARAAAEAGEGTAGVARSIFLDAFDASLCDTGHKHRISAAVQRAWVADPSALDLAAFVTGLIEVGLRELQRFEHTEAAE